MYRASAVITFGTGDELVEVFAVPEVEVAAWSNAVWTEVPSSPAGTYTAYPLRPSPSPPTIFVAQRGIMGLSIQAMHVGSGPPARQLDVATVSSAGPVPDWCQTENWIGAFFIEGVGAPPDQPVVLEYWGEGSEHRLVVDPGQHTVRATAGLVVSSDELRAVRDIGYRIVSVQLARTTDEAFPLIVPMVGDSATMSSGGRPLNIGWGLDSQQLDPRTEWRVYVLRALRGSEPSSRELPTCEVPGGHAGLR